MHRSGADDNGRRSEQQTASTVAVLERTPRCTPGSSTATSANNQCDAAEVAALAETLAGTHQRGDAVAAGTTVAATTYDVLS